MKGAGGGRGEGSLTQVSLTAEELALVATGLPIALQVARRVARTTHVLPLEELESMARLALATMVRTFDADRGEWKSFVAVRAGFALVQALRRERRCASVPVEAAIRAGLAHAEGLDAPADALAGSDEEAFQRLADLNAEVADVVALHFAAALPRTAGALKDAVAELPALEARVMTLHYFEGKSFRQIGREVGCTASEAYRAHGRALARLRRTLQG
jgi:RNA polymerase sigma factor (sigma-70 family)